MDYTQKLNDIEARFDGLNRQMADPAVINDSEMYRRTAKAHSELAQIVAKYREWKDASDNPPASAAVPFKNSRREVLDPVLIAVTCDSFCQ